MAQLPPWLSRDSSLIKAQMISSSGRQYILDETDLQPQAPGAPLKLHALPFIYGYNTNHWTYPGYAGIPVKLSDRSFWIIHATVAHTTGNVRTAYTLKQLGQLFPKDFNINGFPIGPRERDGPGISRLIRIGGVSTNLVGLKSESYNKKIALWHYLALSEVTQLRAKVNRLEQVEAETRQKNASSKVQEILGDLQKALDKCHECEKTAEAREKNNAGLAEEIAKLKTENDVLKKKNKELEKQNIDTNGKLVNVRAEKDKFQEEAQTANTRLKSMDAEVAAKTKSLQVKMGKKFSEMEVACRSYSLHIVNMLTDVETSTESSKKRASEAKDEGPDAKKPKKS